jgi:hypothetical protein
VILQACLSKTVEQLLAHNVTDVLDGVRYGVRCRDVVVHHVTRRPEDLRLVQPNVTYLRRMAYAATQAGIVIVFATNGVAEETGHRHRGRVALRHRRCSKRGRALSSYLESPVAPPSTSVSSSRLSSASSSFHKTETGAA